MLSKIINDVKDQSTPISRNRVHWHNNKNTLNHKTSLAPLKIQNPY